jgi:integrase
MERDKNLLTERQVKNAAPGWLSDGNCLYLRTDISGGIVRKRFICRITREGRKRDFGCGSADKVSLKLARRRRDEILELVRDGIDPVAAKRQARQTANAAKKAAHTFGEAANEVFKNRSPRWKKGSTTPATWMKSVNRDSRALLRLPVGEIGVAEVKSVVKPFWDRGNLVAGRALLSRIEMVLAFATANEWRKGDNPASWTIFEHLFPHRQNGGKKHHPMVAYGDMPNFIKKLRGTDASLSAVALELIAFTALRSDSVRGARWDEFDWDAKLWTVPKERMKLEVEFKVPITDQMRALLKPLHDPNSREQLVFPGPRSGKWIANQTVWKTMQRVTDGTATTHGLRASFTSWCEDVGVDDKVAEACLAHGKGNQTAQAYNRGEMVERRRKVMERWGRFITGTEPDAKVVPIAGRKRRS